MQTYFLVPHANIFSGASYFTTSILKIMSMAFEGNWSYYKYLCARTPCYTSCIGFLAKILPIRISVGEEVEERLQPPLAEQKFIAIRQLF